MTRKRNRLGTFESLETRQLLAADLAAVEIPAEQAAPAAETPKCYLKYKLERCFATNALADQAATAADPDTETAFYYNKLAFSY